MAESPLEEHPFVQFDRLRAQQAELAKIIFTYTLEFNQVLEARLKLQHDNRELFKRYTPCHPLRDDD